MELLEFIKANRQAIDAKASGELEAMYGEAWIDQLSTIRIKELMGGDEDQYHMDEGYMEVTGLTPDIVKEYLDKHDPKYVVIGEEFDTIFITDVDHPPMISNWMTGNDFYFFNNKIHTTKQAIEYELNGKKLWVTWGIPDSGS